MAIRKILELSVYHLSLETTSRMDHGHDCLMYHAGDCRYLVIADLWDIVHEEVSTCPKDLLTCMKYAYERNCEYILFDLDEEPIEDLPTYDW